MENNLSLTLDALASSGIVLSTEQKVSSSLEDNHSRTPIFHNLGVVLLSVPSFEGVERADLGTFFDVQKKNGRNKLTPSVS